MDIRDETISDVFKKEKPDYVIHNAAQISVSNSVKDPINDASVNIVGTLNVLEVAKDSKVKK